MKLVWQGHYVQFGKQHPMKFGQVQFTPNQKIVGKGSDQIGDFLINGQIMGDPAYGNINFVKKYVGKHQIIYKGLCKNGVIHGKWGFDESKPQQDFTIQMKWPPTKLLWRGHYVQHGKQFPMEFHNVGIYNDGKITAQGKDAVGNFQIRGQVNGPPACCQIKFTKQYIGSHKIQYFGDCLNGVVKGKWGFTDQKPEDSFMIQMRPA